ncbi:MAG TPA: MarR family transcriptional regulator [Gemmatimonadales bacterium]|nr:MarR family transcriptional regulator [Gemmatimonadales bacterium]
MSSRPSRLQHELKQAKAFPSRAAEAFLGIVRTAAVLDHAVGDALRPYGITSTQYNVLRILRGAGKEGMCGREVGERLVAQVPDVSRLLDRMVEMGLACRERDTADRRHVTARITPKGLRLLETVQAPLLRIERERFGHLDAATLDALIGTLDAVRAGS